MLLQKWWIVAIDVAERRGSYVLLRKRMMTASERVENLLLLKKDDNCSCFKRVRIVFAECVEICCCWRRVITAVVLRGWELLLCWGEGGEDGWQFANWCDICQTTTDPVGTIMAAGGEVSHTVAPIPPLLYSIYVLYIIYCTLLYSIQYICCSHSSSPTLYIYYIQCIYSHYSIVIFYYFFSSILLHSSYLMIMFPSSSSFLYLVF